MGLFSSKKIITVSSTLYNMAGPESDRPDYLKGTLFSAVMSDAPSITDSISDAYFTGPGIQQRQFFQYADRNDIAGLPSATIGRDSPVDPLVVAAVLPVVGTTTIIVQNAQVIDGDPEEFLERWVAENHPTRTNEDWIGDYEESTSIFSVEFPNGDFFTFTDAQYNPAKRYIVAKYLRVQDDNTQPIVEGTPVSVGSKINLTGWDTVSETPSTTPVTLIRNDEETIEYSDATPTTVTNTPANVSADLNTSVDIYDRTVTIGATGYEIEGEYQRHTYTGTDSVIGGYTNTTVVSEDIGGGVTRTTTNVITGEQVSVSFDDKYDTQQILESTVVGDENIYIYEEFSGEPTLDALFEVVDASNFQEFYPMLPLRLKNKSLSNSTYVNNGLYDETRKAYKKASNSNIDKILDEIENNDSIDDIDYAYIMYGVSLNVEENACRKYIFKFFQNLIQFQTTNNTTISNFEAQVAAYDAKIAALEAWEATDWSNVSWLSRPPRPSIPSLSVPKTQRISLRTSSPLMPTYDIRMNWVHIDDEVFSGVHAGKIKGEVSFEKGPTITWTERSGFLDSIRNTIRNEDKKIETMYMYMQETATSYRRLKISGLIHQNVIYKGKSVKITTGEALDDNDISGFIVPFHYPTVKAMSIVDYTQMATANVHILFNSYEVTKQKWYERGIFKVFLIILVIVIAVIIAPQLFAAGGGILGGNLAVGAALGLTGTAALVAGVVANYLASVVISQILSAVGTQLFGEKWGAIFAAVASFALGAVQTGFTPDAAGFLKIGNALANGYSGWVQGDIAEQMEEFKEDSERYEEQMDEINKLMEQLTGNSLNFNPLSLTDVRRGNGSSGGYVPETADEFIRRTTMSGSDVVDITFSMVYDFVDVQKSLPRN